MNIKTTATNTFDELFDPDLIQFIKETVSCYHWRDGRLYPDGSMGTIRMSSKELRDLLAFLMKGSENVDQQLQEENGDDVDILKESN